MLNTIHFIADIILDVIIIIYIVSNIKKRKNEN